MKKETLNPPIKGGFDPDVVDLQRRVQQGQVNLLPRDTPMVVDSHKLATVNDAGDVVEASDKTQTVTPSVANLEDNLDEVIKEAGQSGWRMALNAGVKIVPQMGIGLFVRTPGIFAEGAKYGADFIGSKLTGKEFDMKQLDFSNQATELADFLNASLDDNRFTGKSLAIHDSNPDNIWDTPSLVNGFAQTVESVAEFMLLGMGLGKAASIAGEGVAAFTDAQALARLGGQAAYEAALAEAALTSTGNGILQAGKLTSEASRNAVALYKAAQAGEFVGKTAESLLALSPTVGTAFTEGFMNAKEVHNVVMGKYDNIWKEKALADINSTYGSAEDILSNPEIGNKEFALKQREVSLKNQYEFLKSQELNTAQEEAARAGLFTVLTNTAFIGLSNHAGTKAFVSAFRPASAVAQSVESSAFGRALGVFSIGDDILAQVPTGMSKLEYLSGVMLGTIPDAGRKTVGKVIANTVWESIKEGAEESFGQWTIDEGAYISEKYTQLKRNDKMASFASTVFDNLASVDAFKRGAESVTSEESLQQFMFGAIGGGMTTGARLAGGELNDREDAIGSISRTLMPGAVSLAKQNELRRTMIDTYLAASTQLNNYIDGEVAAQMADNAQGLARNSITNAHLANWFSGVFSTGQAGAITEKIEDLRRTKQQAYEAAIKEEGADKEGLKKTLDAEMKALEAVSDKAAYAEILYNRAVAKYGKKTVDIADVDKDGKPNGKVVAMPIINAVPYYIGQTLSLFDHKNSIDAFGQMPLNDLQQTIDGNFNNIADSATRQILESNKADMLKFVFSSLTGKEAQAGAILENLKQRTGLSEAAIKEAYSDMTKDITSGNQTEQIKNIEGYLTNADALARNTAAYENLFKDDKMEASLETITKQLAQAHIDAKKLTDLFESAEFDKAYGFTNYAQILDLANQKQKVRNGIYDFSKEDNTGYADIESNNPTPEGKKTLKQLVLEYRTEKPKQAEIIEGESNDTSNTPPDAKGSAEYQAKVDKIANELEKAPNIIDKAREALDADSSLQNHANAEEWQILENRFERLGNQRTFSELIDAYIAGEVEVVRVFDAMLAKIHESQKSLSFSETSPNTSDSIELLEELSAIRDSDLLAETEGETEDVYILNNVANSPFTVAYSAVEHTGVGHQAVTEINSDGQIVYNSDNKAYSQYNSNETKLQPGTVVYFRVAHDFRKDPPADFIAANTDKTLSQENRKTQAIAMLSTVDSLPIEIYVKESGKVKVIGFVRRSGKDSNGTLRSENYIDNRTADANQANEELTELRANIFNAVTDENGKVSEAKGAVFSSTIEAKTEGNIDYLYDANGKKIMLSLTKAVNKNDFDTGRVKLATVKGYDIVINSDGKTVTRIEFNSGNKVYFKTVKGDWSRIVQVNGNNFIYGDLWKGKGVLLLPTANGTIESENFKHVLLTNYKVGDFNLNKKTLNAKILAEIKKDMFNVYLAATLGHIETNPYRGGKNRGAVSLPAFAADFTRDLINKYGTLFGNQAQLNAKMHLVMGKQGSTAFDFADAAAFIKNFIFIDDRFTDVNDKTPFKIETHEDTRNGKYGKITVRTTENGKTVTKEFWTQVVYINDQDHKEGIKPVHYIQTTTEGEQPTFEAFEDGAVWSEKAKAIFEQGVDNSYFRVRNKLIGTTLNFEDVIPETKKFTNITYERFIGELGLSKVNISHVPVATTKAEQAKTKNKGKKGLYTQQPSLHFNKNVTQIGSVAAPETQDVVEDEWTKDELGIPTINSDGTVSYVMQSDSNPATSLVTEETIDLDTVSIEDPSIDNLDEYDDDDDFDFGNITDLSSIPDRTLSAIGDFDAVSHTNYDEQGNQIPFTILDSVRPNLNTQDVTGEDLRAKYAIPRTYKYDENGKVVGIESYYAPQQIEEILNELAYQFLEHKDAWLKEYSLEAKLVNNKSNRTDFFHRKLQELFEPKLAAMNKKLDSIPLLNAKRDATIQKAKRRHDYAFVEGMAKGYNAGYGNTKALFELYLKNQMGLDITNPFEVSTAEDASNETFTVVDSEGNEQGEATLEDLAELYNNPAFQDDWAFRMDAYKTMSAALKAKLNFIPRYLLKAIPITYDSNGKAVIHYALETYIENGETKTRRAFSRTSLNSTAFINPRYIFGKLQELLFDVTDKAEIVSRLETAISRGITDLVPIYEMFAKSEEEGGYSEQTKNEFFSVFSKNQSDFYLTLVKEDKKGKIGYKTVFVNRDSADSLIINRWAANSSKSVLVNSDGYYNKDAITDFANRLNQLSLEIQGKLHKDNINKLKMANLTGTFFYNRGESEESVYNVNKERFENYKERLRLIFNEVGFDYSPADFDYLLSIMLSAKTDKSIKKRYKFNDTVYNGIGSLINDLQLITKDIRENSGKSINEANIFINLSKNVLKKYSLIQMDLEPQLHIATFRANKKSYYSFNLNSLFTRRMQLLRQSQEESKAILHNAYGSNSVYALLFHLYTNNLGDTATYTDVLKVIDSVSRDNTHKASLVAAFDSYRELVGNIGISELVTEFGKRVNTSIINSIKNEDTDVSKEFKETVRREIELQMLSHAFKGIGFRFNSHYHVNNFGDKSVRYAISSLPYLSNVVGKDGKLTDTALNLAYTQVESEIRRIQTVTEQAQSLPIGQLLTDIHYTSHDLNSEGKIEVDKKGNRAISKDAMGYWFFNFDFLNDPKHGLFDKHNRLITSITKTNLNTMSLSKEEKASILSEAAAGRVRAYIKILLNKHYTALADTKLEKWKALEIANNEDFSKLFDSNVDKGLNDAYTAAQTSATLPAFAALMFEFNQHFNNVAFTQIYGDPVSAAKVVYFRDAQGKETSVVDRYTSIDATSKNNSKRNSGLGAPKQDGAYPDKTYLQAVLGDKIVNLDKYAKASMLGIYDALLRTSMKYSDYLKVKSNDKLFKDGLLSLTEKLNVPMPTYFKDALNEIAPHIKTYMEITMTDAAEFVTLDEKITELNAYGRNQISDVERARLKEIFSNIDLYRMVVAGKTNPRDLQLIKTIFAPTKPVYYGNKTLSSGKGFNLVTNEYYKTSSITLIPIFTQGLEIDKLRRAMENRAGRPVSRLTYDSGRKLAGTSTSTIHNDTNDILFEGMSDEQIDSYFNEGNPNMSYVTELERRYLGIQVDTDDNMKTATTQGTQETSIMNLDHEDFYRGVEFTHKGIKVNVPYLYNIKDKKGIAYSDVLKLLPDHLKLVGETYVFDDNSAYRAGIITAAKYQSLFHDLMKKIIDKNDKKLSDELDIKITQRGAVEGRSGVARLANIEGLKNRLLREVHSRKLGNYVAESIETAYSEQLEDIERQIDNFNKSGADILRDSIANFNSDSRQVDVKALTIQGLSKALSDIARVSEKENTLLHQLTLSAIAKLDETTAKRDVKGKIIEAAQVWTKENLESFAKDYYKTFDTEILRPFQSSIDSLKAEIIEKNNFLVPFMFNNNIKKFESIMLSIINNAIVKIKNPGTQLVLTTEFGMSATDNVQSFDKNSVIDFADVNKDGVIWIDSKRKFLAENEILITSHFQKQDGSWVDLTKYAYEKDGAMVIDFNDIDPAALEMFAFRIPTQGYNNLGAFKVAGFLPRTLGPVVVANKTQIGKMGFDFDYDKLFIYWHNYKVLGETAKDGSVDLEESIYEAVNAKAKKLAAKDNAETYEVAGEDGKKITRYKDFKKKYFAAALLEFYPDNKVPKEHLAQKRFIEKLAYDFNDSKLNKEQLQNYLLDLRIMKLSHPDIIGKSFLTNGYGEWRKVANLLESSISKKAQVFNFASSEAQVELYLNARFGKQAVGYWAKSLINLTKAQTAKLYISSKFGTMFIDENDQLFSDNVIGKPETLNLIGLSRLDKIYGEHNEKISTAIQNIMSLVVDDAKTPTGVRLNFNFSTFGVVNLLVNTGITDASLIAHFINQEIIKDYINELGLISDTFSEPVAYKKSVAANNVLKRMAEAAGKPFESIKNDNQSPTGFKKSDLIEMFNQQSPDNKPNRFSYSSDMTVTDKDGDVVTEETAYYDFQRAVLKSFMYYDNINSEYRKTMNPTNTNTSGLGSFFTTLFNTIQTRSNLNNDKIGNSNNLMKDDFYQHMYEKGHLKARDLFEATNSGKTLHPIFTPAFSHIVDIIAKNADRNLTENDYIVIIDDFMGYLKTGLVDSLLPGNTVDEAIYKLLFNPNTNIANQFLELSNLMPQLKDNIFFKLLHISNKKRDLTVVNPFTGTTEEHLYLPELRFNNSIKYFDNDAITRGFADLLLYEGTTPEEKLAAAKIRAFGKNLVAASFLTGQSEFSANSWSRFIPANLLNGFKLSEFANMLDFNIVTDFNNFIDQFHQNNKTYAKVLNEAELEQQEIGKYITITDKEVIIDTRLLKEDNNNLNRFIKSSYLISNGTLYKKLESTEAAVNRYVVVNEAGVFDNKQRVLKSYDFAKGRHLDNLKFMKLVNTIRDFKATFVNNDDSTISFDYLVISSRAVYGKNKNYKSLNAYLEDGKIVANKAEIIRTFNKYIRTGSFEAVSFPDFSSSDLDYLNGVFNNGTDFYYFNLIKAAVLDKVTKDEGETSAEYNKRVDEISVNYLRQLAEGKATNKIKSDKELSMERHVVQQSINNISDKIVSRSNAVDFDEASHTYLDENGVAMVSASTATAQLYPFSGESDEDTLRRAQDFGNKIDVFAGEVVNEFMSAFSNEPNASVESLIKQVASVVLESRQQDEQLESFNNLVTNLVTAIHKISKEFNVKKVITQAKLNNNNGIAGTSDILLLTPTGHIVIDIKTMASSSAKYYASSYADKHTSQLSIYDGMLREVYKSNGLANYILNVTHDGFDTDEQVNSTAFSLNLDRGVIFHTYKHSDYESANAIGLLNKTPNTDVAPVNINTSKETAEAANQIDILFNSKYKPAIIKMITNGARTFKFETANALNPTIIRYLIKLGFQEVEAGRYTYVQEKPANKLVYVQMQRDNKLKILKGTKTSTVRSESQMKEIGLNVGETGTLVIEGVQFNIFNKGLLTVEEAGGEEAMRKSEGFGNGNPKYEQTKKWLKGEGRLYVYAITPANKQSDVTLSSISENVGKTKAVSINSTTDNLTGKSATLDSNSYLYNKLFAAINSDGSTILSKYNERNSTSLSAKELTASYIQNYEQIKDLLNLTEAEYIEGVKHENLC